MAPFGALPTEQVLRWLVIAIVSLFVASLALGLFVLAEHARRNAADVLARSLEERWNAALHDVLAGAAPMSSLIALVEPHERWHFAEYLSEFAARLKGEELEVVREAARVATPRVVALMGYGSAASRARNVRVMALLGGPENVSHVVAALASRYSLVSATAVRWLSRPEYAAHAREVIARLPRFAEWSPRFLGVLLSRFGSDAAPPLRALLESAGNGAERVGAARALWWMKDASAAESAARLLSDGELDAELAESCLRLIERCGVERHAISVRPWCTHADKRVRAAALSALCVVGEAEDSARVTRGLEDADAEVALDAAFALARARRGEVEALTRSDVPRTAAIAREALVT